MAGASSALEVELRPGQGLGLFELGSSLWMVLDSLRHNTTLFPRVDVKYDPDLAASTPIILHIHPHLDLVFTGLQQRLRTISLRRLRDPNPPVRLSYNGHILSSSDEVLQRSDVSRYFGPTFPGEGLRYPGVSFLFDEEGLPDALKGGAVGKDDRTREVRRVLVGQSGSEHLATDALDNLTESSAMVGDIERAIIKVHEGVTLLFYPSSSKPIQVRLGETTAQDLTCDLGAPLRVFYKEDDRMAIHSINKSPEPEDGYFYNYFQYGIDFLLSGTSHTVQKIVMHTNLPGTPMFQRYQRCPWEILGRPEDDEDDSPPRVQFHDKFEVISRFLCGSSRETMPSMLLDRGAEDNRLTLPSNAMRLVGFDGVVLEVTESAQVATVTLF